MQSPTAAGPATRAEFLTALRAACLLTRDQIAGLEDVVPLNATPTRAAHALVEAGWITKFQAGRLLAGKSAGFHVGPYIIQEKVGEGAMGKVFRAKHRMMHRAVAVKVLRSELTKSETVREFVRNEVRAAAQLHHANVVTVYDSDELGEYYYLALEYIEGASVETLVHQRGPLGVQEACEFIRQAALGLAHAHDRGMVHLSIKPANLLVTPNNLLKIADFGIAKLSPSENRDFIAPEQAHYPQLADARADIYSLGAVFYFLLTGRTLFPKGTLDETVQRHMFVEPFRVERMRSEVPAPVAALLHEMIAKQPEARPASAAIVAARLGALMGIVEQSQLEVTPGPIGTAYAPAPETVDYLPMVTVDVVAETSPWGQVTVVAEEWREPETQTWEFTNEAPAALANTIRSGRPWAKLLIGLGLIGAVAAMAGKRLLCR